MSDIFYLPKHPINQEKHILKWFYTNEKLPEHVHFAYTKPIQNTCGAIDDSEFPIECSVIKLTYKMIEAPNCEGVAKYELKGGGDE